MGEGEGEGRVSIEDVQIKSHQSPAANYMPTVHALVSSLHIVPSPAATTCQYSCSRESSLTSRSSLHGCVHKAHACSMQHACPYNNTHHNASVQ